MTERWDSPLSPQDGLRAILGRVDVELVAVITDRRRAGQELARLGHEVALADEFPGPWLVVRCSGGDWEFGERFCMGGRPQWLIAARENGGVPLFRGGAGWPWPAWVCPGCRVNGRTFTTPVGDGTAQVVVPGSAGEAASSAIDRFFRPPGRGRRVGSKAILDLEGEWPVFVEKMTKRRSPPSQAAFAKHLGVAANTLRNRLADRHQTYEEFVAARESRSAALKPGDPQTPRN